MIEAVGTRALAAAGLTAPAGDRRHRLRKRELLVLLEDYGALGRDPHRCALGHHGPLTHSGPGPGSGGSSSTHKGDHSIQTYGSEAAGPDRAAVLAAIGSFSGALGSHRYTEIRPGLSAASRAQHQQFPRPGRGGATLKSLPTRSSSGLGRSAGGGALARERDPLRQHPLRRG